MVDRYYNMKIAQMSNENLITEFGYQILQHTKPGFDESKTVSCRKELMKRLNRT